MMRKPRLYFDTSVFGGIYDIEFEYVTELLFEMVKNGHIQFDIRLPKDIINE